MYREKPKYFIVWREAKQALSNNHFIEALVEQSENIFMLPVFPNELYEYISCMSAVCNYPVCKIAHSVGFHRC